MSCFCATDSGRLAANWGFPTGYANKGERHEDTIAREVREETGLTVKAGRLLKSAAASGTGSRSTTRPSSSADWTA